MSTLTGREEEVLRQLYQGLGVREIAELGEVSEATVRSQVKAILRKLEVNSQIAAVAAYEEVQSSFAVRSVVTRAANRESTDNHARTGGPRGRPPFFGIIHSELVELT